MKVHIYNDQEDLKIRPKQAELLVKEVVRFEKQKADQVAVYFVDKKVICKIHKEHFNDPSFTDCMSFPMDPAGVKERHLGEILICPLAAIKHVKKHGGCPMEELSLYIVHSLLHLMGYDDIQEQDRLVMFKNQDRHMKHLRQKGLILN